MEYKNNKKFPLAVKKKVGEAAVANKRKQAEKPVDVWNAKKRKCTKTSGQIGYKAKTVREMFSDMKEEKHDSPDFKNCFKFVGRCEELLVTGKFKIEGNDVGN